MLKKYSNKLVTLHWLTVPLVIFSLVMGILVLAELPNNAEKINSLRVHMLVGFVIGLLTLIRIFVKKKHEPLEPLKIDNPVRKKLIKVTHFSLYTLLLLMVSSGVSLSLISGVGEIAFFGSTAALPEDFEVFLPKTAHAIFAKVLFAFIGILIVGVLLYKFKTDSSISKRMCFGK
ncbi:MAG TPA: cytochrome b [Deltaproteobacteria bacterium]|nr:cytochrome b [Deltaproteobacteria bacterium]